MLTRLQRGRPRRGSCFYSPVTLFCVYVVLPAACLADANTNTTASSSSKALCPDGWKIAPNKHKCFMHFANALSWDESEIMCQHSRGHLAALDFAEDLSFAQLLCTNDDSGCWIGGRVHNVSAGPMWAWSDNISIWNDSIFPGKLFQFRCMNTSCGSNIPTDLCTLITKGDVELVHEKCTSSHNFICMVNREDKCYRNHCHKEYFIILAVVSGLILSTALAVVIWLLVYRRNKRRRKSRKVSGPAAAALVPPPWKVFTSDEIRSVTKNFSEGSRLLGDAKTGGTYGGLLPDGSRVAIKRLRKSRLQRKKEFFSEVGRVAKLHHPNLVAVKGCCYDHGDHYIVYEFIPNGPLDRWLHHLPRGGRSLDWQMRMRVATTLAQGIAFLHDKVKPHVVHRDIRASNVLLDEEFGAHLMGVGLSKFVSWEVMHERTKMAGSCGYLAPEFIYRNELTTKSDVYSFGVLLLEIISGRRPAQTMDSMNWQGIFEWATPLVQSHRYLELLDPLILDAPEVGTVQKVVDLIYACTQHVPSVRPRMSHVVHQLQQLRLKTPSEQSRSGTSTSATSPLWPARSGTSSSTTSPMLPLGVEFTP